ncbi:hypothetical protein NQT62_08090 [Limnobacter humi]|uniref:DUF4145 domain-containing protein n=1 Tax=Limnobacter humi TaxID=1778671 RepID=A0ABT1WFX8_9BURK|nr:hypothetical protein [Limnobacter humi]MCQ8896390.1 hypothetical protein [Limnobacter humi]
MTKRSEAKNIKDSPAKKIDGWLFKASARIESLETALKITPGFFWKLCDQGDDWSFLIKVHALLEMAIGHLIQQRIGIPELDSLIEKASLNGGTTSKIKIASALSLIDKDTTNFVDALSNLRNKAAHRIDSVALTMDDFIQAIDEKDVKNLFLRRSADQSKESIMETVKIAPRFTIWISALNMLTEVYEKKKEILAPSAVQYMSNHFLTGGLPLTGLKGLLDLPTDP